MEQLNAIAIHDEEGLVAKPRRETVELDEWWTQKLRTPDRLKLSQDELNTSPNQLKVGDKVLLDAADPRITTSEPNEKIPLTVFSIFPYGYFGLLSTAAQSSSLTLIDQMSPQGISSMLSMRMIKKRRGTYPPQYRLAQSTEEEDLKDIPDDVPQCHEDLPTQSPPPSSIIKSSKAHHRIGTKNSTEKGSPRLSCPARPRP
ncbi:hypothetical protein GOBAR_AA15349 [Gossypium barbadense]|uniref:Uncharacterized protein n=1 Tax=Gossypium barbadense TaxID=3634 RepID=A0A2P5XPP6_GOSBA|nr:hypothetical protein GOBAR_AA15349 [Gossypium barbadense]